MQFRIADTFTDSLTKLTGEEQKSVKTTAFDLQMNSCKKKVILRVTCIVSIRIAMACFYLLPVFNDVRNNIEMFGGIKEVRAIREALKQ